MGAGFFGETAPPEAGARLECGVCWWVYDPREGDPAREVPPGTPFAELPAHWSCPCCEAPRAKFLLASDASDDG
jgi:rubredoxin